MSTMIMSESCVLFFFSSRRRHTRCALVTGVQTCALPISATSHAVANDDQMLAIICVGSGHRILSENALNRSDAKVLKGCAPGSPTPSLDHGKARQCRQGKTAKDQKTGLRAARTLLCKATGGSEIQPTTPPAQTEPKHT